jgi:hypothetical protein
MHFATRARTWRVARLYSEHVHIHFFLLRIAGTMTSQNIDLSSWDTLYTGQQVTLSLKVSILFTNSLFMVLFPVSVRGKFRDSFCHRKKLLQWYFYIYFHQHCLYRKFSIYLFSQFFIFVFRAVFCFINPDELSPQLIRLSKSLPYKN